jgi:hypothetical protein
MSALIADARAGQAGFATCGQATVLVALPRGSAREDAGQDSCRSSDAGGAGGSSRGEHPLVFRRADDGEYGCHVEDDQRRASGRGKPGASVAARGRGHRQQHDGQQQRQAEHDRAGRWN